MLSSWSSHATLWPQKARLSRAVMLCCHPHDGPALTCTAKRPAEGRSQGTPAFLQLIGTCVEHMPYSIGDVLHRITDSVRVLSYITVQRRLTCAAGMARVASLPTPTAPPSLH